MLLPPPLVLLLLDSSSFFSLFCKLAAMFVFYILKISQPLSTGDDPSMGFKGGFFFLIDKFLAFSSCLSELTGSVFVVFCTLPPTPKRIGGGRVFILCDIRANRLSSK